MIALAELAAPHGFVDRVQQTRHSERHFASSWRPFSSANCMASICPEIMTTGRLRLFA